MALLLRFAAVLLAVGSCVMARTIVNGGSANSISDNPAPVPLTSQFVTANGVFPSLTGTATSAAGGRSECGVGAMMAWADRLWVVTYLSVPNAGAGTGLYSIDQNMVWTAVAAHNSTYANRMLHPQTNQIVIGPYLIDAEGGVRVVDSLLQVRIGGMAEHIVSPATMVYLLGMDGQLWELNVVSLALTFLYNLTAELEIPSYLGEQPHFKAAHSMAGLLWVASNTFEQADGLGLQHGGRLATWTGNASDKWTIVERTAFFEVTGRKNMGCTVWAAGWDDASVILKVLDTGCAGDASFDAQLQTYRLPKASHAYDHLWTTEWPRIREVESERYLFDAHGMYYELASFTWGGAAWGIRPISQHLRMVPDFASFRGFLVLGGNQVSSIFDNNLVTGQAQSGLWWGTTDDLWQHGGKPQGWGGPWRYDNVTANTPSDPYLMTGFDRKCLHLRVDPSASGAPPPPVVTFSVQVDFTGAAGHRGAYFYMEPWSELTQVVVKTPPEGSGYAHYVFESGFSAHWVRFVTDVDCNATAFLTYT